MFKWASLAVGLLTVLLMAVPTYWSYQCRSSGNFCEGSFVAPDMKSVVTKNRVIFEEKISSSLGEKEFEGIRFRKQGHWFFRERLEVVAKFRGQKPLIIDTLNVDIDDVEISYEKGNKAAVISIPSFETSRPEAEIFAYIPVKNFLKRHYKIKCNSYGKISIQNLSFSLVTKKIFFDLSTSCKPLNVTGGFSLLQGENFEIEKMNIIFGKVTETSVTLNLSETYNVLSALTKHEIMQIKSVSRASANKLFTECVNKIKSRPFKKEGELFGCYNLKNNENFTTFVVTIFSWKNRKLIELETHHADSFTKDPKGNVIFTTDHDVTSISDLKFITLNIHKAPFSNQKRYTLRGECSRMLIAPVKFIQIGRFVLFELLTDCTHIWINGTRYSTGFMKTDRSEYIQKIFRLELDANWLVTGMILVK